MACPSNSAVYAYPRHSRTVPIRFFPPCSSCLFLSPGLFLCYSDRSCTLTEVGQSADCKMMVHSVGESSQWGQIRANLVSDPQQTPLQHKLDRMAKLIG